MYSMRLRTGSQCSLISTGVIWSLRLVLVIIRAHILCSRCILLVTDAGKPYSTENRASTTEEDEDVEKHWRNLKTDINNSIENTVGFKWTSVSRKKQTAWWNEELKSKVKYEQRCFRLWMKSRTPESREAYTTARREAHKFKRQSKKDSWNILCEEMDRDVIGTKKLIYQLATSYRKGQQQRPFTIKMKDSDEIITEPEEVMKCWTDYFSNLHNVDSQVNDVIGESRLEDTLNVEEITEDAVKRAVDRSRNGKAPGCDIIPNEIYTKREIRQ